MRRILNSDFAALTCGLALGLVFIFADTARADQIVALVDEHGHKVYINTGDPAPRPVEWIAQSFRPIRSPYSPLPAPEVEHLVKETANRFQVDPQLVHAIIRVESEYNPNAVSRKGAMGLMQLIPATAQRFGVENPFDPKQNIIGGVTYLKYLLDLFGGDLSLSLAAYNAGENSVLRFGGIPSFTETREYVRKVTSLYGSGPTAYQRKQKVAEPYKAPIYRYVDAQGVVHFTNVE